MQVTVQQLEPCKVAISVEVEAKAVQRALDQVFSDLASKVAVPGFRKGRAPRHVIERFVDAEAVQEQAVSNLVPEYFRRAIEEQGVEPVAHPEFTFDSRLETGQPFRFTATVPTQPEVRLGDYRDVPAVRRNIAVAEQEVDRELEALRQRAVRLEDTDAETATGRMIATVDLNLYRRGRRLTNRSRADVAIDMDDATSIPAFSAFVQGMRIGEEREMPVRFPDDYGDSVLAGKEVLYRITLKALKAKALTELTDEFAKSLGIAGVESLADLRARVREDLGRVARAFADRDVQNQIVEHVVARSDVQFPEVLIQEYVSQTLQELNQELQKQGTSLDEYLQGRQIDFATYERELKEDARRRVRTQLVLDAIATEEQIAVSQEELAAELRRRAGVPDADAHALLDRRDDQAVRNLRSQVLMRKVMDRLLQSARVTEE